MRDFICRTILLLLVAAPVLQILFLILKLYGAVCWSWPIVLLPAFIVAGITILVVVCCYIVSYMVSSAFEVD